MYRLSVLATLIVVFVGQCEAQTQPTAIDNELTRFRGHWRIIEMIEDGRAVPQDQMRNWLPGGGVLEIVDYTIIFKSPLDGSKSTKSFRLDATSYPKQVAILERDSVTGTGIYKYDQGKLVICVTKDEASVPTEFSAATGSKRTLLVLERFDPGQSEVPGMNARLPQLRPVQASAPAREVTPVSNPTAAKPVATPPPTPIVATSAAARVLTDPEVRTMALGTWRINDGDGSVDIVINENGVFRTFRYLQSLSHFHVVFVPTPISSGDWTVTNGRLIMNVRSSTRADQLNQVFAPAVRSISANDLILVDQLGRVSRAVKVH